MKGQRGKLRLGGGVGESPRSRRQARGEFAGEQGIARVFAKQRAGEAAVGGWQQLQAPGFRFETAGVGARKVAQRLQRDSHAESSDPRRVNPAGHLAAVPSVMKPGRARK